MLPKHSAKDQYFVPEHKKGRKTMCLIEKKLYSGIHFSAVDCVSTVNESTMYIN